MTAQTRVHTLDDLVATTRATITRAEAAEVIGVDRRVLNDAIEKGQVSVMPVGAKDLVLVAPLRRQLLAQTEETATDESAAA